MLITPAHTPHSHHSPTHTPYAHHSPIHTPRAHHSSTHKPCPHIPNPFSQPQIQQSPTDTFPHHHSPIHKPHTPPEVHRSPTHTPCRNAHTHHSPTHTPRCLPFTYGSPTHISGSLSFSHLSRPQTYSHRAQDSLPPLHPRWAPPHWGFYQMTLGQCTIMEISVLTLNYYFIFFTSEMYSISTENLNIVMSFYTFGGLLVINEPTNKAPEHFIQIHLS